MKNIIIIIILFFFVDFNVNAQEDYRNSIPQRPIKPTISVPKFLDSNKLIHDIKELKILKNIYLELKQETAGSIYTHAFFINKKGRVILGHPETEKLFKGLNKFVKDRFVKYQWLPAHKLDCRECLVETHGVLTFNFDPEKHYISCYIHIMNEKSYKVFYRTINIE